MTNSDEAARSPPAKRFFHLDDDGVEYLVVARDQNHAEQIL